MVQKVNVVLVDDIDQSEASETVTFGLDGVSYEIDLSDANAAKLRSQLESWVSAGRRVSGRRSTGSKGRGRTSDAGAIRTWANDNGYTVSERGRIPADIRAAYEAAN